jgi:hypothetical protein
MHANHITHVINDCGSKQMNRVECNMDKVILFIISMLQQQNDQHSELL